MYVCIYDTYMPMFIYYMYYVFMYIIHIHMSGYIALLAADLRCEHKIQLTTKTTQQQHRKYIV